MFWNRKKKRVFYTPHVEITYECEELVPDLGGYTIIKTKDRPWEPSEIIRVPTSKLTFYERHGDMEVFWTGCAINNQ